MGKAAKVGEYNGYSSCPLFVGDEKLMLIEFKYNGVADESVKPGTQQTPSKLYYWLKKDVFPRVYWGEMA